MRPHLSADSGERPEAHRPSAMHLRMGVVADPSSACSRALIGLDPGLWVGIDLRQVGANVPRNVALGNLLHHAADTHHVGVVHRLTLPEPRWVGRESQIAESGVEVDVSP